MVSICRKRLKCLRNFFFLRWKWLSNCTNGLNMWDMTYICSKWLTCLRKRPKYVGNDVDMWDMTQMCGKWLKYLTNGLNVWELTQRFGKWLKYL